jgi:hypothetical protein
MPKSANVCWNCGFLKGSGNCAQCQPRSAKAKTWAKGNAGSKR